MKFNREEGLTLIELLITIAVIAIVAAISVPVITNVINDSNTNATAAMQTQVDAFVAEGAATGTVSLNGSTLELRIDQDGNTANGDEYLVKTFPVDAKFSITGTGEGPFVITNVG